MRRASGGASVASELDEHRVHVAHLRCEAADGALQLGDVLLDGLGALLQLGALLLAFAQLLPELLRRDVAHREGDGGARAGLRALRQHLLDQVAIRVDIPKPLARDRAEDAAEVVRLLAWEMRGDTGRSVTSGRKGRRVEIREM